MGVCDHEEEVHGEENDQGDEVGWSEEEDDGPDSPSYFADDVSGGLLLFSYEIVANLAMLGSEKPFIDKEEAHLSLLVRDLVILELLV